VNKRVTLIKSFKKTLPATTSRGIHRLPNGGANGAPRDGPPSGGPTEYPQTAPIRLRRRRKERRHWIPLLHLRTTQPISIRCASRRPQVINTRWIRFEALLGETLRSKRSEELLEATKGPTEKENESKKKVDGPRGRNYKHRPQTGETLSPRSLKTESYDYARNRTGPAGKLQNNGCQHPKRVGV
jgi:hypothetical protein